MIRNPNPFVQCPTCGVRALVLRDVFDRIPAGELRKRYPQTAARLVEFADDERVPVSRPEFACQSCGATFDGSKAAPA